MELIKIYHDEFKKFTDSPEGEKITRALVDALLEYKDRPSAKAAYIGRMIIQFLEFMEKDMEIKEGHLIIPFVGMILARCKELGIGDIGLLEIRKEDTEEKKKEKPKKVFVSNGNEEIH